MSNGHVCGDIKATCGSCGLLLSECQPSHFEPAYGRFFCDYCWKHPALYFPSFKKGQLMLSGEHIGIIKKHPRNFAHKFTKKVLHPVERDRQDPRICDCGVSIGDILMIPHPNHLSAHKIRRQP